MTEWRWGRGWSEAELRLRLGALGSLERNAPERKSEEELRWRRQDLEEGIGREEAGPPVPGGAFDRAREVLVSYGFSDPRIVSGHYDPARPLEERRMLLELRILGLRFLCPTAVGEVLDERGGDRTVFGYRYDTLEGHVESGVEWFLVSKDHASGEVRFRIASLWRPGQFPNWWSRAGFRWLGPRYQTAWHQLAFLRMRELVAGSGPLCSPRNGLRLRSVVFATGLGGLAGARSMLPPAIVSAHLARERGHAGGNAGGRLMASVRTRNVLAAAAVGEMAADKTPWIPPRTEPRSRAACCPARSPARSSRLAGRGSTGLPS